MIFHWRRGSLFTSNPPKVESIRATVSIPLLGGPGRKSVIRLAGGVLLVLTNLMVLAGQQAPGKDPEAAFQTNPVVVARVRELIARVKGQNVVDALFAAEELAEIGKPSVPALLAVLEDENQKHRYFAASALGDIGPDAEAAVAALVRATSVPDPELREGAVEALGKIGAKREVALPALRKCLSDASGGVRLAAAAAILQYEPHNPEAAAELIAALMDANPGVRTSAVKSLGRHRSVAKGAVENLTKAVNDAQPGVRKNAIELLGELGPDAKGAVETLIEVLNDRDVFVRTTAIDSLAKMRMTARPAVPALTALLKQANVPLSPEAQKIIDEAARLLKMSTLSSINVALHAAMALEEIEPGKTPARQLLTAMIKDEKTDFWDRLDAAVYLATTTADKTALEVLIAHVRHTDQGARSKVAHALARLGRAEAAAPLAEDLTFDNQPVRIRAAAALGKLGPAARSAIPALVAASENPFDAALRQEARRSLSAIQQK